MSGYVALLLFAALYTGLIVACFVCVHIGTWIIDLSPTENQVFAFFGVVTGVLLLLAYYLHNYQGMLS